MTFKLLKRRYRSTDPSEKLRRLDYFNQPFEANSEIRLIDDVDMPKPVALESLATQFEAIEPKRGAQNAVDRSTKSKKQNNEYSEEFKPFDPSSSKNF